MMDLELGSLNFREAGSWSLGQKLTVYAVIAVVIIALGVGLLWYPKYEEIDSARHKEMSLRSDFAARKVKTINHDLYIEQLDTLQREFGVLVKNLPNRSEIDALLVDVNQAGIARGLVFDLFKPSQSEKKAEFYAEIPINIVLTGDYHGMGGFVSDVAALPRIVTVNDVTIEHNKNGVLQMTAVAKTFRYLEPSEQQAAAPGTK
jgi:type IV pilus assembly protein PilO